MNTLQTWISRLVFALLAGALLGTLSGCSVWGSTPEKNYQEEWSRYTKVMERTYPRGSSRVAMQLEHPDLNDYPALKTTPDPFVHQAVADCEAQRRGTVVSAETRLLRNHDGGLLRDYVFYDVAGNVLMAYRQVLD